ncbi:MAG: protease pro-enzyme activation domain-containing protein [Candidatus Sulfopaludibacter sp.]|nr:protease pro-enzyme activation domain-containing protein [Candidatus Sulfopaludibacter sp.]
MVPYSLTRTTCLLLLAALALAAAQDRITAPVDPGRTALLKGNVPPRVQAWNDRGRVDPYMSVPFATLHLKPAAGLAQFLADQQNSASPDYRRWLTPEQFADRFGLSAGDLDKIANWLRSEGLQIHNIARGRHWITFSGTADQVSRAFHTEIHRYLVNGEPHFANATEPSVPAAIAGVVSAVRGLDDFRLESEAVPMGTGPSSTGRVLAPDDLAVIYDLKRLYDARIDGTGQTIAILGQTAIDLSDIQSFRTRFNLPANTPQVMLYGPDPGVRSADLPEADVDLEWSGAVARNATIVYVYSGDVITSAQYAIDQNVAPVMSLSYGGCEAYNSNAIQAVAQQANAQGITWLASSGDEGAVTCDRNDATPQATLGPTVSSPASLPEVTAVGGTEFTNTGSNYWAANSDANGASALSYVPEKAWNDFSPTGSIATFGTGGGASVLFPKPAWQTGPGVPNDNARDLPDISLASSGTVPYTANVNGKPALYGGTSLATPALAGLVALVNQHAGTNGLGNINPALYRLAQATQDVFHDVSAGNNKAACLQGSPGCVNGLVGWNAGTGFDMTTGLGSVDGYNLVMEWSTGLTTFTTLQVSPNTALNLTDTGELIAAITASGVPPTGTVAFLANETTVGTAAVDTSNGSPAAAVSVSAAVLAGGNGTVTALYSGDSVYNGSQGSARFALRVPAGAAFVVPFAIPNPVYQTAAYANWEFTVGLAEKAGVATSITAFTIDTNNDLSLLGPNPKLAANGILAANLASTGLKPPQNRVVSFSGTDANGIKWTQKLTVPFLAPLGTQIAPGISLTSPTTTVQQNPQADPSCQWSLPVSVQETGGYPISLTAFSAGGTSLTSRIQTIFGTTRLAPFGALRGIVCFSGSTPPAAKSVQISGTTSLPTTVTATLPISFTGPATAPAAMSTPVQSVALDSASGNTTASLPLNLIGGVPQFTTSVSPANRTSAWLTVTPAIASGSSSVNIQASAAGLSPGVYNAVVSIQAVDALPQVIQIPVTFVVGGSSTTQITAVGNAWTGNTTAAPGMILSVYGTQLANPVSQQATRLPLPLVLGGVSATVNGFSAPLYYVSPGQINLQVPYEAGAGRAVLAIDNNGQIASFPFTAAPASPGLNSAVYDNSTGAPVTAAQAGGGQVLLLFVTGEGDVTPTLGTGATPSSTITDPTKLPHSRLPLTLTIGGIGVTPLFAGIPAGLAGATQIDFQIPANVPAGNQPIVVTVGGVAAAPVNLNVTAATSN